MANKFTKLLLLGALALPVGCKLITAAPTPGVTQFYSQAALVLDDFSGVLVQAQQLFTTAHGLGFVSDVDFATGQQVFSAVATNGDAVQALIKAGGDQTTVEAQLNALITQVGTMPAAFHITDSASQAEFVALTTSLQSILKAALTLV